MTSQWRCCMKKTWSVTNLIVIILLAASSFVSAKGILEMRSMRLVVAWLAELELVLVETLVEEPATLRTWPT